MPIAHVRGVALYYEVHGSGFPLLLIGALGASVPLHRELVAGLAAHGVIAFDNRGSGRSDKPDIPYSIQMMALDALGLMGALGIEQTDIVGISMGGRIALEIAADHPARVRKLVLVSTSAAGTGHLRMSLPMRLVGLLIGLRGLRRLAPQPPYAHLRQRQAATG
ncbi:alpha/beta fold hydrolase [Sinomonas sp.]|uniref:alpha/beta fold hydrolase n=1 Tax=Sinomonas sp. TaxID=1914986 RepID=UPI002FE16852